MTIEEKHSAAIDALRQAHQQTAAILQQVINLRISDSKLTNMICDQERDIREAMNKYR